MECTDSVSYPPVSPSSPLPRLRQVYKVSRNLPVSPQLEYSVAKLAKFSTVLDQVYKGSHSIDNIFNLCGKVSNDDTLTRFSSLIRSLYSVTLNIRLSRHLRRDLPPAAACNINNASYADGPQSFLSITRDTSNPRQFFTSPSVCLCPLYLQLYHHKSSSPHSSATPATGLHHLSRLSLVSLPNSFLSLYCMSLSSLFTMSIFFVPGIL